MSKGNELRPKLQKQIAEKNKHSFIERKAEAEIRPAGLTG